MSSSDWWRGAVIYQIYPRSFYDSNGDGIGDLQGITQRLEHVASLGCDAVWISPFFQSPMKDFGYDVSDFRRPDPIFGKLEDVDALIERAHSLGLRVVIDHVLSHTSDAHAWFVESRANRDNPKKDWYVWADPKPDGTPPNNWLSIFGGSAWQFEPARQQYYMHNFLVSQPDLNFQNEEVQDQMLDELRFWLERGVDGFRLDTVNYYFHDVQLRDNPANATRVIEGVDPANPYGWQQHVYDKTRPENLRYLERIREVMNAYPGTVTVGEVTADRSLPVIGAYTSGGDKLHTAYCFAFLTEVLDLSELRAEIQRCEQGIGDGWMCWALSNHDVSRTATRWSQNDPQRIKLYAALLLSLRGTACVYQGEELGLPEADVPFESLQDPYGIAMWPTYKGRDGCRTPLPWSDDAATHGGFTQASRPWLPVPSEHLERAVSLQADDSESVLACYRSLIRLRRQEPVLQMGRLRLLDGPESTLVFERYSEEERMLCAFNLSDQSVQLNGDNFAGWSLIENTTFDAASADGGLRLGAYSALHAKKA